MKLIPNLKFYICDVEENKNNNSTKPPLISTPCTLALAATSGFVSMTWL